MISYFTKVSSTADDLTWDRLQHLLDSPKVAMIINAIRAESDHDKRGALKRELPAVTWQSHFPIGTRRKDVNANPTGFFMMDIDHVSKPIDLWNICRAKLDLQTVLIAHITPSGEGLRIVMKNFPQFTSIADNQKHLANLLQLKEYDAACKDFARLSYLCRRADVLYLNNDLFTKDTEIFIKNDKYQDTNATDSIPSNELFSNGGCPQVAAPTSHSGSDGDVHPAGATELLIYNGKIPYEIITKALVSFLGGEPQKGTRNTFLYKLARQLRYIVDFNPLLLSKILPSFGLPQTEVESVAQSACKSKRSEKLPYALYTVLNHLDNPEESDEEDEEEEKATEVKLPPLPPIFKEFVRIAPDDFKVPSIVALLPVMGTLMSRLRAKYIDGEVHAPNFSAVIEAPQASGKSFARRIVKYCMKQVEYMDSVARLAEQQYLSELRKARNSKKQPEEPTAIIREIPASVSIAKLLKRLSNAKGLHLFTFLEELDTLTKSNKAGAWSQKTDIYRNAFDNADYGQEYMSDVSYSGVYPVYYNMLTCGTPAAVDRFYSDPEDGLVSRVIFCQLPSQFGAKIPIFKELKKKEVALIEEWCNKCNDELCCTPEQEVVPEHHIFLGYLNEAISKWLEEQRLLSIQEVSISRNIFYRRAAVIGFRAGMLAHYLYGEKNSLQIRKKVVKFSLFVANYVLDALLDKFDSKLEAAYTNKKREVHVNLYSQLPDNFDRNEVAVMANKFKVGTSVKQIIWSWKANNYIEETEHYKYKKVA